MNRSPFNNLPTEMLKVWAGFCAQARSRVLKGLSQVTSLHHLGPMSQEFYSLPVLVSFPAAITNCSDNSSLRKKGLFYLTVQSYSPALLGKTQRQVLEADSDIVPKVKEQRTTHRCMLASAQQPFFVCAVQDSTQGMVCLHTSINISKTIPHRQAQRCISRVTLGFVTLTTLVLIVPQKQCQMHEPAVDISALENVTRTVPR